ncbi:MAG: bacillithiol biosynthesis BshC [Candidatus Thorarchaeota archaeon]|nr:bacillithiol biosynthesis BshC [Candidatus Thorarchaeota archaeon]
MRSVVEVYQSFIWRGTDTGLAALLYDTPPVTLGEIPPRAVRLRDRYQKTGWLTEERISKVADILTAANRRLGALTPSVKRRIEMLSEGAVEAAHQAVCMGGPVYVLNKAATAARVAAISERSGVSLAPFFFVADYDEVQPELTNMRTPLLGAEGNLVSFPVPEGYEYSPVSVLPAPSDEWYVRVEESVRAGYRPLFKVLDDRAKTMFEERLEQALSVVRWAFYNSQTLGEWSQKILARLLNIECDLGVPLLPASDPQVRETMVGGMEYLLASDNRDRFLRAHDQATQAILQAGLDTGMGKRPDDYVPFFYECPGRECHRARMELHYESSDGAALLRGRCPVCQQHVEIEADAQDPDLSQFAKELAPRVDTRQMVVDMLIPTVCHVGGPGEAAYYAQVIPVARELGITFPMFVKYPRVYFNTPWGESMAARLKEAKVSVIQSQAVFGLLGSIARARKKGRPDDMNSRVSELERLISQAHSEANSTLKQLLEQADMTNEENHRLKFDLECYLSWAFGQYTLGKLGQESTWSWIEWAVNAGFRDLMGPYERAYDSALKNGSTLFVNFMA